MIHTISTHAKQLGYSDKEIERFVYKYGYRKSTRLNQEIKTLLNTMYRIDEMGAGMYKGEKMTLAERQEKK